MNIVVLAPMLGRAELMPVVRDSLHDTTDDAQVMWLVTSGDVEVVRGIRPGEPYMVSPPRPRGDYAAKMNAGIAATDSPLIFLGSSDIRFHPGWWEACQPHLAAGFGVVGTNDACNPRTATGDLSTHTLLTRWYADLGSIDNPNVVLHPGYWHEFVDDEFVGTAKARGMYAHAPDALVEHLHPIAGKRPADTLDGQLAARMRQGRRLFLHRRHLWT